MQSKCCASLEFYYIKLISISSEESNYTNYSTDGKQMIGRILVLCTYRLREVYRLFESLFKSFNASDISIIYVTFEQIKPFLTKDESLTHETPLEADFVNENKPTDETNEEYLLDCFRTSSLILIFFKHLDESYLTSVNAE